jgi:hypothetical protein
LTTDNKAAKSDSHNGVQSDRIWQTPLAPRIGELVVDIFNIL